MTTFYWSECRCWGYVSYDNSEDATVDAAPLIVGLYEIRSYPLLNSPWPVLSSWNLMISRAQENEGANTVDLKANLRSSSLLQLRLLDRDHVIRLLLTPCGIWHFNLNLTLLFIFIFLCLFLLHLFFPPLPPFSASFYHSSSPSSSSSHSSFSSSSYHLV